MARGHVESEASIRLHPYELARSWGNMDTTDASWVRKNQSDKRISVLFELAFAAQLGSKGAQL
jgi:hypothetical protein